MDKRTIAEYDPEKWITHTYKHGNCEVTVHRPILSDEERRKREEAKKRAAAACLRAVAVAEMKKAKAQQLFDMRQINFMRSIGLDLDFDNLSDDDFCTIEETVADKLTYAGFDKDYNATDVGRMCEDILALLP